MPTEYYFQCQQNILSAIPSVFYNTDKIENPNKQFYDEGIPLALKNTSEIFIIYQQNIISVFSNYPKVIVLNYKMYNFFRFNNHYINNLFLSNQKDGLSISK